MTTPHRWCSIASTQSVPHETLGDGDRPEDTEGDDEYAHADARARRDTRIRPPLAAGRQHSNANKREYAWQQRGERPRTVVRPDGTRRFDEAVRDRKYTAIQNAPDDADSRSEPQVAKSSLGPAASNSTL